MKYLDPVIKDYHFIEKEIKENGTQLAGAIPLHKLLSSKKGEKHLALEKYGVPVGLYVKQDKCSDSMSGGFINTGSGTQPKTELLQSRNISDEEFDRLFSSVDYSKTKSRKQTRKIRKPKENTIFPSIF
jgi:hypothetical protein